MRQALILACVVAVALGLWLAPWSFTSGGAAAIRTDEGAYRMRMCELALWSGESVVHDRMLESRAGSDVPYGPFAPAASAFVLARALPRGTLDLASGSLDEDALADGARRLLLILAWLGAVSLGIVGRRFGASAPDRERSRDWTAALPWIAALAWTALALAPSVDGGSVRAAGWSLILGAANLWGAAKLARPRELVDQLALAIGVGVITGVALLNDPFAWPGLLAPAIALWLSVRGAGQSARRDALRSGLFFAACAVAVFGLSSTWPGAATPLPRIRPEWVVRSGVVADPCIQVACLALLAWLALAAPRNAASRALTVVLVASFVLRTFDARFAAAPLAPAGCAFVAWACATSRAATDRALRVGVATGVSLSLVVAAACSDSAQYSAEAILGLRELRDRTAPTGAWNHPAAPHSSAIMVSPGIAGAVVFHARRAVCGGLLPGADASPEARESADALLGTTDELLRRAGQLDAHCLIVGKRDHARFRELWELAGRPTSGAGLPIDSDGYPVSDASLLRALLCEDELPGLELVRRVPERLGSGETGELAIWRVVLPDPVLPEASLRAR